MNEELKQAARDYIALHFGKKGDEMIEMVERVGNESLYHISTSPNLKGFVPKISDKRYPGETVQIPRASFGKSIAECILGYGGFYNVYRFEPKWDGIYRVYEPVWDLAFKPSKVLVPDVQWTNEHWLLFFKPELFNTPAEKSCEFFVTQFNSVLKGNQEDLEVVLVLRTIKDNIQFVPGIPLKKGYYRITIQSFKCPNYEYRLNENTFVDLISEKDYIWALSVRTNKYK